MPRSVTPIIDGPLKPAGYQQITSLSTSTALTAPSGSVLAVIQAEDQDIRYRDDGTAPTASVGMVIEAGQTLVYNGSLSALRLIQAASSAKANVSYYKV